MDLGLFSISLAVQDLAASRAFYEKLGFEVTGGDEEHYAIMVNGTTVIGLFEGMFEKNILIDQFFWTGPGRPGGVYSLPSSSSRRRRTTGPRPFLPEVAPSEFF